MVIKLHRMLALVFLCIGLFVAGGPAVACCAQGTPTHDCCPSPSHPVGGPSDQTVSSSDSQICCAVASHTTAGTAFDMTGSETRHQADAPFAIIYLATLSTVDSSSGSAISSTTLSFVPALLPVYLRTGRLRL